MTDPIKLYHKSASDSYQKTAVDLISASTGESHEVIKKNRTDQIKNLANQIKKDTLKALAGNIDKSDATIGYFLTREQKTALARGEMVVVNSETLDMRDLLCKPAVATAALKQVPQQILQPVTDTPSPKVADKVVPEVVLEANKSNPVETPKAADNTPQASKSDPAKAPTASWQKKHLDVQLALGGSAGDIEPIFYRTVRADKKTAVDNIAGQSVSVGLSLNNPIGKDVASILHIKDKKTQAVMNRFTAAGAININERRKTAERQFDPLDPTRLEHGRVTTKTGEIGLNYSHPLNFLSEGTKLTIGGKYGHADVNREDQTNANVHVKMDQFKTTFDLSSPFGKNQSVGMFGDYTRSKVNSENNIFGKPEAGLADGFRSTFTLGMKAVFNKNIDGNIKHTTDKWTLTNTNGAAAGTVSYSEYNTWLAQVNYKMFIPINKKLEAVINFGVTLGTADASRPNPLQDFSGGTKSVIVGMTLREPKPKAMPIEKKF